MSESRPPAAGYNHNTGHLGWEFHIQTEDSGPRSPLVVTHLFHAGAILATKKLSYDPSSAPEFVRDLMQAQHKAVLRELKAGRFDEKIRALLGEPPSPEAPRPVDEPSGGYSIPPEARRIVAEQSTLEWTREPLPRSVPASWAAPRALPPLPPRPPSTEAPRVQDVGSSWILRGTIKEQLFDEPPAQPVHVSLKAAKAVVDAEDSSLRVDFDGGEAFLRSYFPNGASGGLLVDVGSTPLALGRVVVFRMRMGRGAQAEFEMKGRVAWKRTRGSESLGAGVGIEFLSSEKSALQRLMKRVQGEQGSAADRKFRRVSAPIKVKLAEKDGESRKESAADISEGGIFVTTSRKIAIGKEVIVTLKPPGAILGSFDVRGRVTWSKDSDKQRGLGVMFLFDSDEQRQRLQEVIGKLRQGK